MSLGVKVALRGVLNEDVARYIQQIANSQRHEMMRGLRVEYFEELSNLIENKIDAIEMDMEERWWLSEYGSCYLNAEKKLWEWSYILDDIFYNSNRIVNSKYRLDPGMM